MAGVMDGPTFENQLRKDWCFICSNIIWSPGAAKHLEYSLHQLLNLYQSQGEIARWSVSGFDVQNRMGPDGYGVRILAIVVANFPYDPYSYQVCLGFDSDLPPEHIVSPPKTIDRWEAIAMEMEDEVPLHEEELKQKDRPNSCNYVVNGDVPYFLPPKG